jgi:hypothetical protein
MKRKQRIPDRLRAIVEGPLTEETWDEFEILLEEIDTRNNALLPEVLECFACVDDDVEQLDSLWCLIHRVEGFDQEAYLHALVDKTPFLQEHAPESLGILWVRILNSVECHNLLKHNVFPSHDIQSLHAYLLTEPDLAERVGDLFA